MVSPKLVRAWMHKYQQRSRRSAGRIFAMVLGIYVVFLAQVSQMHKPYILSSLDELYSISSLILGVLFGCYSGFVMSRWWELRVATGGVSGSVLNIAIYLKGYLDSVPASSLKPEKKNIEYISSKLKVLYIFHVSEVLRMSDPSASVADFLSLKASSNETIFGLLSELITKITQLSDSVKFSDSIKFSLLPAIQSEINLIKSNAGDAIMVLNCRYPRIFSYWMYTFLLLHVGYLPLYLFSKLGPGVELYVASSLGFGIIGGFAVLVETHFKDPFKYNNFKLHEIAASTLNSVSELLRG